jgi:uncharacterized repeat protein (TIGR03803 family)
MKKQILIYAMLFLALRAMSFAQYTDIHNFCCNEGGPPQPPGILAQGRDGNLYGSNGSRLFRIGPIGVQPLYAEFHTFNFGNLPERGGLTLGTDGYFYGTTISGGTFDLGTIFKVTPSGALTILHNFTGGSDGANPIAPPVQGADGSFYGTTTGGQTPRAYKITPSGTFTPLGSLPGLPIAPLIQARDGNFYGTTISPACCSSSETVFKLTTTGKVTVVYLFNGTHGSVPNGGVVQGNDGNLYGAASSGGAYNGGVVFKLTLGGSITVQHNFDANGAPLDGWEPLTLILATDGNFYGTTRWGGTVGGGVLFRITPSGVYSVLNSFDDTHGSAPVTIPMQHTNGELYGLTEFGGNGSGVVYRFNHGLKPFVKFMTKSGKPGQTVEILGQGLTGTTKVIFGTGSASFTVISDTYMTAVVPVTGTTGSVKVTTPSGVLTSTQIFKVIPTISSFTPTSGPVGTQVVIKGTGLTQTTKVTFGDVTASFVVNAATQVSATVPTAAITSKITITTTGGVATSSGTFTVTNSLLGRCVVSNGKMTGYCIGVRSGVCREAFDPTNCPQGQSVTNVVLDQCAQSTFTVDGSRACTP